MAARFVSALVHHMSVFVLSYSSSLDFVSEESYLHHIGVSFEARCGLLHHCITYRRALAASGSAFPERIQN